MVSAILLSIPLRYAGDVLLHVLNASCAASNARSMSSLVERAALAISLPSIGEVLSKYSPYTGGTNLPPMKLSYISLNSGRTTVVLITLKICLLFNSKLPHYNVLEVAQIFQSIAQIFQLLRISFFQQLIFKKY